MVRNRDEILQDYIQRISALRDERGNAIGAEELRSIAIDMGMTDADLANAEAAARDYRRRGQGFFKHGQWDDAIAELTNAAALSPADVHTLHALALAHLERSKISGPGDEEHRAEAERLARRCLELDAGHEASFTLLDTLRKHKARTDKSNMALGLAAMAILLLALIGTGAFIWSRMAPGEPPEPPPPTPYVVPSPMVSLSSASPGLQAEFEIPVVLVGSASAPRLELNTRMSRLNNYSERSWYTLKAALVNRGTREFRKVQLRLELRDANGTVIGADALDALDQYQVPMRPGDIHLFDKLKRTTPGLHDVRLTVQLADTEPAPAHYASALPVKARWAIARPEHIHLDFKERSHTYSGSTFAEGGYGFVVLEVHNSGGGDIHELKYQVAFYNKANRLLKAETAMVTYHSAAPLLPGETRIQRSVAQLPAGYDRYEVTVLEVD